MARDLANPLMVKEVYQGFRGWGFTIGVMLLLVGSAIAFALVALDGNGFSEVLGAEFFSSLIVLVAIVGWLSIPAAAGMQLRGDINSDAMDLIAITGLSPWRIIWGRFQGGLLKLIVMLSCVLPFAVAATLLGGIGSTVIIITLIVLMAYSIMFIGMHIMFCAAPAVDRRLSIPSMVIQMAVLLITLAFGLGMYQAARFGSSFGLVAEIDANAWWIVLYLFAHGTVSALVFMANATDMITFEAVRHYARSKRWLAFWFLLVALPLSVVLFFDKDAVDNDVPEAMFVGAMIPVCLFLVFYLGQQTQYSRWRRPRFLPWIFGDGFFQTLAYASLLFFGVAAVLNTMFDDQGTVYWMALYGVANLAMYCGLATMIRCFMPAAFRTFGIYVILIVVIFLLLLVIQSLAYEGRGYHDGVSLAFLPFHFDERRYFEKVEWNFLAPLALGSFFGLIAELVRYEPKESS